MTHCTDGMRGALAVILLVAAAVAGVSLTAGIASAVPTGITECTTITESGAYELRADLGVEGETCLTVAASDVTVDGDGHTVERTAPSDDPTAPAVRRVAPRSRASATAAP